MYKNIENIYINESPYNKIIKRVIIAYIVLVLLSALGDYLCSLTHLLYLRIIIILISVVLIYGVVYIYLNSIFKKYLQINLIMAFKNKRSKYVESINKKEYEKFKDYVIKHNIYNEKSLNCILYHYREMKQHEKSKNNLLVVLSIALPVVIEACDKKLPWVILSIAAIILIYYIFSGASEVKLLLSGRSGMNARLEEIFTELYIECINETFEKQN